MIDILYEDNHIIVCYKPKGILSQSDGSDTLDMLTILKKYIKEKYNKPNEVYLGLVHRLDINTSGVMVFARTSKAASRLSFDISNHNFKKKYLALVEGKLPLNELTVLNHKLLKDEKKKKAYVSDRGLNARLEYTCLKHIEYKGKILSLVDINLLSGRFHQIRCQFASIGHPLYGDKKYGSTNNVDYLDFPLEAYYLSFVHPTKKEWMVFEKKVDTIFYKN